MSKGYCVMDLPSEVRSVNQTTDIPRIRTALIKALKSSCSSPEGRKEEALIAVKECLELIEVDSTVEAISTNTVKSVVLNNSVVVVYDIGSPWYNPKKVVVQELLVLALEPGSNLDYAVWFLDCVAEQVDADGVLVGTTLSRSDKALSRAYAKRGFTPAGSSLYKARR